jgi:hypothetical protein
MYYALGALLSTGHPCSEIESVIVQPRCFHPDGPIRSWVFPAVEIIDFAADVAKFATLTEDPKAELVPGEHCRFCPAAGVCPKLQQNALETAKQDFSPVTAYDPVALGAALEALPMVEGWVKQVREFAYQEAASGKSIPGWKLVAKRPTRRWIDEKKVEEFLELRSRLPQSLTHEEPALKSPAQIEKLIGKALKDDLAELIVSESSGNTLAHESDKRPAVKALAFEQFTALE